MAGPLCLQPDNCKKTSSAPHCRDCVNAEQRRLATERLATSQRYCDACGKPCSIRARHCRSCARKAMLRENTNCIDCDAPTEHWALRCPKCAEEYAAQPKTCLECGKPVSAGAKVCRVCQGKRKTMKHRKEQRFCADCHKPLPMRSKAKRCRICHCKDPEKRRRTSATMKNNMASNPKELERVRNLAAKNRERINTEAGRALIEERRQQTNYNIRKAHLPWCPSEYWDYYRKLRIKHGAVNARKRVERLIGGPLKPVSVTIPQMLRNECTVGSEVVRMRPAEMRLLSSLLVQAPNKWCSTAELLGMVYPNPDDEPDYGLTTVQVLIYRLRRMGIRVLKAPNHNIGYRIPEDARGNGTRHGNETQSG